MPIAQASLQAQSAVGQVETLCSFHGAVQVWVGDQSPDSAPDDHPVGKLTTHCPLCAMGHHGMMPLAEVVFGVVPQTAETFRAIALGVVTRVRAWSAPATGPPTLY